MRLALFLLPLLLAAPAAAQERPPAFPTRDAAVLYRLEGSVGPGGNLRELRMSFLAARGLVRVDLGGGQGWIVADARARSGFVVAEAQGLVLDLPPGSPAAAALPREEARFVREGSDVVAGSACTIWRVEDAGRQSRACIAADGLLLRAEAAGREAARMEAVSVSRAPLDPALFDRPPARVPAAPGSDAPRGTALPPPGLPGR